MKLNVKAFAGAFGIFWGGAALIMGLWAMFYEPTAMIVNFFGNFYIGYAPGFFGALIGGLWGFLDGAVSGLIFAWLYNLFCDRFKAA